MMGLPLGWVCDVPGVTRNMALRMLGNGVVPLQAAAAFAALWALREQSGTTTNRKDKNHNENPD